MPNWCVNKLSIYTVSDEQMEEFLEFVGDGENVFSLENIIPMPEELAEVQHPVMIMTQEELNDYNDKYKDNPWMTESGRPITQETCDYLMNKYGITNWYEWRYNNWGTKSDACDAKLMQIDGSEAYIDFETAWGPPSEDIKLILEARFPDITILWLWYEEGMQIAGYL